MADAAPGPSLLPVRWLPTDDRVEPEAGIGLCLSGGGYRAMVFHLGALWRLTALGWLPRRAGIWSAGGGSIPCAALALAGPRLDFDQDGVARRFEAEVVGRVRALAGRTIDESAFVVGLLTPDRIGKRL